MISIHASFLLAISAFLALRPESSHAHTFLTSPNAYNRVFQLRDCVGPVCRQACPPLLPQSEMANTRVLPAARWRRGDYVTIQWAKNNHKTGFVRFALVPVSKMMERNAHERLAIYHGCFTQGLYQCDPKTAEERCGADQDGMGYSRPRLKIPTVFPDGKYVFGLVWYGGLHLAATKGTFFADFWSCSHVSIEGGEPLGGSYQPFFDVGDNRQAMENGNRCRTARTEPGLCQNDLCEGSDLFETPAVFANGQIPKNITASDIGNIKRS